MPVPRQSIDFADLLQLGKVSSAEMDTTVVKEISTAPKVQMHRRGVSFNPDVYVQEIIHINDMSDEEVFNAFWSREDYYNIKVDFARTAKQLSMDTYSGDNCSQCSRGLEYRHRKGSQLRKLNKLSGLCSVLDEQERQRIRGEDDDEKLSRVYYGANMHCRLTAHKIALEDQEVARVLHDLSQRIGDITLSVDDACKQGRVRRFFKNNSMKVIKTNA